MIRDPRTFGERFADRCRHMEQVHAYDFGRSVWAGDDWDAVRQLHHELHERGDFGAFRHPVRTDGGVA